MRNSGFIVLLFLLAGTIGAPGFALSQENADTGCTDISKMRLVKYLIEKDISYASMEKTGSLEKEISSLQFIPRLYSENHTPDKFVTKKLLLKFRICNSSDSSSSVWFYPGIFFPEIRLYQINENRLSEMPVILPEGNNELSFRKITLKAHDSVTILAELLPLKTYTNSLHPKLIQYGYINSYLSLLSTNNRTESIFTYIFSGLLLMMIFFSLANYLQSPNNEFLFYAGYAFFTGFMLFLKSALGIKTSSFNFFLDGYLDFIMQGAGIIFYMIFMKKFLETKTRHRFLYYLYNWCIAMVVFALLLYSFAYFFTNNFSLQNKTENLSKMLLLLMVVVFLVYSFRNRQDRLLWYMFWGNLCLLIFSLISQSTIFFFNSLILYNLGIFISGLFYYEIGLWLELLFFLMGLNYKNKQQLISETKEKERLIAENKVMEYEKELAILKAQQEERNRISADMHDELGSGMTVIRLMSEIALDKMKDQAPAEIEKISDSANEVLNKMNTIIWTMNSGNDTLDNLIYYIRTYALEYFEGTPIDCTVNIPAAIQNNEMPGARRRNIFLSVKEALNNVLKHSGATKVTIDITSEPDLKFIIRDNGSGIDPAQTRLFGNGLKNMAKRMESIGGSFKIESNNGTTVTFFLPL